VNRIRKSIEILFFPVLIFTLISFSGENLAHGLSCEPFTLKDQFNESDAVFVGKVISKEKTSDESMFYVTFNVTGTFKGITNKTVTILSSETIWKPHFEKGTEYVILAGNYNGSLFDSGECTHSVISTPEFLNQVELLKSKILPPLQQLKNGVLPENIVCKDGLQLIFKSSDDSPACVKPETKIKLIEREWTKQITKINSQSIFLEGFQDSYKIDDSIRFTLVLKAGQKCGTIEFSLFDTTTSEFVNGVGFDEMCTSPYLSEDLRISIPYQGEISPFKIEKIGSYKIVMTKDNEVVLEKEFFVNSAD
jgi:hypothetical protein